MAEYLAGTPSEPGRSGVIRLASLRPGHEDCRLCATCGLPTCPDCTTESQSCPIVHDSDLTGPCDHCGQPLNGYGSLTRDGVTVRMCHPDDRASCYIMVTVYGHPTPCPDCPGEVPVGELRPVPYALMRAIARHQFSRAIHETEKTP
ncbi:MAG TPA: hypothetical protein DEQ43_04560 [Nocardioides bacterium]|nr:hypothetical protein [Nocardioides sp.]